MDYIKSPMNYIGNKYRIIGQLERWFPKRIGTMVDLFCGGGDVAVNTAAARIIANDINVYVIRIFQSFQKLGLPGVLSYIDATIETWGLSKENKEAYLKFRDHYNNSSRNPLDLYILMCYSFNYQFRFNEAHEYNNPFGANRSSFNEVMRANLVRMIPRLMGIEFISADFTRLDLTGLGPGDFLYADPPYLLTCGSYNDGKRGFKGWSDRDEQALYALLDRLDAQGVQFALSNVSHHKGKRHTLLLDWKAAHGYHMHRIAFNYDNCNYHANNRNAVTREVLITNY
ncbi:MAG: DNA adenine methylase [Lachnospiraceae bacterium]|nr:DNA adenine methylase [Lachnospiraceae bacterium]